MKTLATFVHLTVSLLFTVGWGGLVVVSVATKGWYDDLIAPVVIALISAVYVVIGFVNRKGSNAGASALGIMLTVPLVGAVAEPFDFEMPGLIIGGVPAFLLGLCCVVHAMEARRETGV
ncbi:MAG: hypothetical protein ACI9KE_004829 [Polyangiales bacterium]|jgi:hypothetical protein